MATVPNWIAKGYVLCRSTGPDTAYPVAHWRATRTQVIVQVEGLNGEYRFALDDLRQVARRGGARMTLLPPHSLTVAEVKADTKKRQVITDLRAGLADRLDPSMGVAELRVEIIRMQRAATKALADLADML